MNENRGKFLRRELTLGLRLASKLQKLAEAKFYNEPSRRERRITGMDFTEEGIEISYEFYAGCGDWERDTTYYSLEELITQAEERENDVSA